MTLEQMIQDLQTNMQLHPSQVTQNHRDIMEVRARFNERLAVLSALDKANQAICTHPREFRETVLTNNTDGYEYCKACGDNIG